MNRPPTYPMSPAAGAQYQLHTATSAFMGNGSIPGPAATYNNGPLNGAQLPLTPVRYPPPPPAPLAHMGGANVKPSTLFHQQANQTTMINNIDPRSTPQSAHNSATHLMSPQYSVRLGCSRASRLIYDCRGHRRRHQCPCHACPHHSR
jgi:hypothetical protein